MKKKRSFPEQLLDEVYDLSEMLKEEGKSYAERRNNEIMARLLLLLLDGQKIFRTSTMFLLGLILGTALNILLKLA